MLRQWVLLGTTALWVMMNSQQQFAMLAAVLLLQTCIEGLSVRVCPPVLVQR